MTNLNQWDDKAVAWYQRQSVWVAGAVGVGIGFIACTFLGVVF